MGLTILILLLPVIFLVAAFWQGTLCLEVRCGIFFRDFTPDSATISQKLLQRLVFTGALVVSLVVKWSFVTTESVCEKLSLEQLTQQLYHPRCQFSSGFNKSRHSDKLLRCFMKNFYPVNGVNGRCG